MKKRTISLTGLLAALSLAFTALPAGAAVTQALPQTDKSDQAERTAVVSTESGRLRIRKGKGTGYEIAGYLHHGDTVTVLDLDGGWAKIRSGDLTGYCSADYLLLSDTEEEEAAPEEAAAPGADRAAPEAAAEETARVSTESGRLRVREGKGTGYDITGYLHNGDTVTVLERDGDWAKIRSGSLTGYCSADFLVPAEPEEEEEAAAPAKETAPAEEEAPAKEAAPAEEPAPAEEAAPAEEPAPAEEEVPAEEEAPAEEPAPAEEEAPAEETAPAEEPVPAEEPAPAEETAPAEEEAPEAETFAMTMSAEEPDPSSSLDSDQAVTILASAFVSMEGTPFQAAFQAAPREDSEAGIQAGPEAFLALPENQPAETEADTAAVSGRTFGLREYIFDDASMTCWLTADTELLDAPFADASPAASLERTDAVQVTGTNDQDFWEVSMDGMTLYVDKDVLTSRAEDLTEAEEESELARQLAMKRLADETADESERARIKEEKEYAEWMASLATQTRSYYWDGPVLSRSNGSIIGPSGKETYYNLNMSGVVSIMRGMGVTGEYWVRNDGCKMLGNYIMCAANLSVHPRGSLVECSLGTCMVCDTGGFASHNPYQLDIATTW